MADEIDWKKRYDEYLAASEDNGARLPPVSVDVNNEQMRPLWDGQDKLKGNDARNVISARLGIGADGVSKAYIDYVLLSIPESAWTERFLKAIDLRPYADNLAKWADAGGTFKDQSQTGRDVIQQRMVSFVKEETDKALKLATDVAQTDAEKAAVLPASFSANSAGLAPDVQMYADGAVTIAEDGTVVAPAGATVGGGSLQEQASQQDIAEQAPVTYQDMIDSFTISGSMDIRDLEQVRQNFIDSGRTPPDASIQMVDTGGLSRQGESARDGRPNEPAQAMSPREAILALYNEDMTPQKVTEMQRKLAAAGYFDGFNQPYVPGEKYDQVTAMAYNAMLADAFKTKTPVSTLLERKRVERAGRFGPIGNYEERLLQQVATATLGRQLDDVEMLGLQRQLIALKSEQLPGGGGADGTSESGGGVMSEGMWFGAGQVERALVESGMEETNTMTGAASAAYDMNNMIDAWMNDVGA